MVFNQHESDTRSYLTQGKSHWMIYVFNKKRFYYVQSSIRLMLIETTVENHFLVVSNSFLPFAFVSITKELLQNIVSSSITDRSDVFRQIAEYLH